jgi:hypothetical protein
MSSPRRWLDAEGDGVSDEVRDLLRAGDRTAPMTNSDLSRTAARLAKVAEIGRAHV